MWGQTILKTNPKIEKKQHYKKNQQQQHLNI